MLRFDRIVRPFTLGQANATASSAVMNVLSLKRTVSTHLQYKFGPPLFIILSSLANRQSQKGFFCNVFDCPWPVF